MKSFLQNKRFFGLDVHAYRSMLLAPFLVLLLTPLVFGPCDTPYGIPQDDDPCPATDCEPCPPPPPPPFDPKSPQPNPGPGGSPPRPSQQGSANPLQIGQYYSATSATTSNPIHLKRGSTLESVTDLSVPGPHGGWSHTRKYDSLLSTITTDNPSYNIQGNRWTGGPQTIYLQKVNASTIDLYLSASSKRTFTVDPSNNAKFTTKADFDGILTRTVSQGHIVYTLTYPSNEGVFIFKEKDPSDPCWGLTGVQSKIVPLVERTNYTYQAQGLSGETYFYNSTGRLILTVTADPQAYCVRYTYHNTGSVFGYLKLIEVFDRLPDAPGAQKIAEAEYYYNGSVSNAHWETGSLGDLIQVRSSKRMQDKTTWDHKYTQYRYYQYYDSGGVQSQLKYVFEPDAVERILKNNTGLANPEAILARADAFVLSSGNQVKAYAARGFEHYTYNHTTANSFTSIWGVSENFHTKYGGTERSEVYTYYSSVGMVKSETITGGCTSCGGSSSGSLKMTYYYMLVNPETTTDMNAVVYMTIEDIQDSANVPMSRTIYGLNRNGVELRRVYIEDPRAPTLNTICTSRKLDADGQVTEARTPMAHAKVNSDALIKQFLNPYNPATQSWANDLATLETSQGMISLFEYDTSRQLTGARVKIGFNGVAHYTAAADYNAQGQVSAQYVYPTQTTNRNAADRVGTTYAYTYWNDTLKRATKTRTTTYAATSTTQNGSNTPSTIQEYFDEYGKLRWMQDASGVVTYFGYHPVYALRTLMMQDVNTSSLPSLITTNSMQIKAWTGPVPFTRAPGLPTALNNSARAEYDDHGYLAATISNDGMTNYYLKQVNKTLQFPAWDTATNRSTLPINVTETDAVDNPTLVYQLPPSAVTVASGRPTGVSAVTRNTLTAYNYQPVSGAPASVDNYHTVPASGLGALGTNYYRTGYIHDPQGRRVASVQYVDTNKWQLSVSRLDWQGRTIETLQSVRTTQPTTYANISGPSASDLKTLVQAEYDSDGKPLKAKRWFDTGANDYIGVKYNYDSWNRLRGTTGFSMSGTTEVPFGPYRVNDYDWRDNITASAVYETEPNWSTVVAATTTTNRRALSRTYFTNRGQVYRTEVYQVAANGTASSPMTTNYWYDQNMRQVGGQVTSGPGTEIIYDTLGQNYQTRTVKALASTKYSSDKYQYVNPQPNPAMSSMTGGGAGVVAISHTEYDTSGNAIREFSLDLNVGDTVGINFSTNNYVRRSVYHWYDKANRPVVQADYGSGAATWAYAAAPSRPGTAPTASSSTLLVSKTVYNANTGMVDATVDPMGRQHNVYYDALGRTRFTAQNFASFNPTNQTGSADPDKDVATGFTYNGLGSIVTMVAYNPTTGNQVTKYLYEDVADASRETNAIYPDSTDMTSSGTDQVKTAWFLDGNMKTATDQNGTVHTYGYDTQRRLVLDNATTLGTGVDGTVRKILRSYDALGRLATISSLTSADVVVNQNRYEYDTNWKLKRLYSSPDGAVVVGTTPYIEYTYDTAKNLRLSSTKYPGGKAINYVYGTGGSLDDVFSRPVTLVDGGTTLVTYQYAGTSQPRKTTYNQPGLILDYGTTGLDRHGRIIDHAWKNSSNADVVRIQHGYDYNGNRLYRKDVVGASRSEFYSYDGLNQVKSLDRGTLNSGNTSVTGKNFAEQFTFDKTGNFANYKQDATGGGTWGVNENRTHSKANEIATIAGVSTNVASDKNGNMTKMPKPNGTGGYDTVYDAWNRLVQVKDGATTVATYSYNGMNHRVKKVVGSETRLFYFNHDWQCLEERIGSTVDLTYTWGLRYIDDLICRDKGTERLYCIADTNWNVAALANTSGTVLERMTYSAFGKVNWLDASFGAKTASGYAWTRTFTGQVLDNETGLMLYRNRYYDTGMGRFVNRDPIEYFADDVNLYRYVFNMPIDMLDPLGLWTWCGAIDNALGYVEGGLNVAAGAFDDVTFGLGRVTRDGAYYLVGYEYTYDEPLYGTGETAATVAGMVTPVGVVKGGAKGGIKAAQKLYPGKAGKIERHHTTPKYLGGPKDGATVDIDAAYHQVITNEFRKRHPYGLPSPDDSTRQKIMHEVYSKCPLPGQ